MKRMLLYLSFTAVLLSCKKDKSVIIQPPPHIIKIDSVELKSFKLEAAKNKGIITKDISGIINNGEIKINIPSTKKANFLIFTFNAGDAVVKVNGKIQLTGITANDFTKPVTYTLTSPKGTVKTYKVTVVVFTGLPIFYLTTEGPVVSKEDYVKGNLAINTNNQYEQEKENIPLQIKGRGNSTWFFHPKKPYRLKFTEKVKVLGLGAAKNWVLLANYSDKTLMRTSVVFDLGNEMKADFTPHGRFVELVMNGEYLGNYLLTEQVEVHENRVNITELKPKDTDADKITGGYLIEYDQRKDEEFLFESVKNIPFAIKAPEDINEAQFSYIRNYIQETEDAIFSSDFADPEKGYAKYINVNSFINWFLIQELVKNQDSKDYSSIFYYKDRNGKLGMGPLWDFDLSMGNVDYSEATQSTGWWVKDGIWFSRLFEDPAFKVKVRKRWNEIKLKEIPAIFKNIDKIQEQLNLSQQENFVKWDILNTRVWPNPEAYGTYAGEVEQIKSWLAARKNWLDSNL